MARLGYSNVRTRFCCCRSEHCISDLGFSPCGYASKDSTIYSDSNHSVTNGPDSTGSDTVHGVALGPLSCAC